MDWDQVRYKGGTWFSVLSNLAYVAAGVPLLLTGTLQGLVVGIGLAFLGVASACYHHYYTQQAQLWDERAMYVSLAAMVGAVLSWNLPELAQLIIMWSTTSSGILLAVYADRGRVDSYMVVPTLVVCLLMGVWLHAGWLYALLLFFGYLGVMFISEWPEDNFWPALDRFRIHYDWLHGFRHLGTALLLWLTMDVVIGG